MHKSSTALRVLIREMINSTDRQARTRHTDESKVALYDVIRSLVREDYNVSIVASPISSNEKTKRGQKPEKDVMTNVIMTRNDFDEIVKIANEKDVLRSLGDEDVQAIKLRIDEIRNRVGPAPANLARALINRAREIDKTAPGFLDSILYNMPKEDGSVTLEHPKVGHVYPIPDLFKQLALVEKPGAKGSAVGKGEALAILMFGRAESAGSEPDLIVSEDLKFSIKYFSTSSAVVYVSAGLGVTPGVTLLIDNTRTLRKIAADKNLFKSAKNMSRRQVGLMLKAIYDDIIQRIPAEQRRTTMYVSSDIPRADLDPSGIADEEVNTAITADQILTKIEQTGRLWDTISFSQYPILALMGGADMKFITEPASDCRLGAIDFSKSENIPELKIASPRNSRLLVSPGASQSLDDDSMSED